LTGKALNILLAEDDGDDVLFFREALDAMPVSCNLAVVNNGEEAVGFFSQTRQRPDFVFLDINMPKLNGIEALRAIRAMHPSHDVYVIMLSTSVSEHMVDQSYRFGASLYVQKPTRFADLKHYLLYCLTQLRLQAVEPGFILNHHLVFPVK